jgi:hypothetical protein
MLKEVMKDLWLARISSLSNEFGLYVVLPEVLLFMPNSLTNTHSSTCRSTREYYLDYKPTNFFSYSIKQSALGKTDKYQFHNLFFDPTTDQTYHLPNWSQAL